VKRTALKRTRPKAKPRLSQESAMIALERFHPLGLPFMPCICGCGARSQEWHHVFDQNRYPELADDPDNIVPVAARCHADHTSAKRRLPRFACRYAERLAVTPQMENHLARHYLPDSE
jgi:hypothetical protein